MHKEQPTVSGNGSSAESADTLILTYNRATDRLEVGGQCNSLDLMLDMLARATRMMESLWRLERLKEVQRTAEDQARTNAILNSIRGKG